MFYFGFIELGMFRKRFNTNFLEVFKNETDFLKNKGFINIDNNIFSLTKSGFEHLGGIIPMFYSSRSQQELINIEIEKILK